MTRLDMTLFPDDGYTYNDQITRNMSDEDVRRYLLDSAIESRDQAEPEVEYGILRELVHRFPDWSHDAWTMLRDCARRLKKHDEARAAAENGERLIDARHGANSYSIVRVEGPGGATCAVPVPQARERLVGSDLDVVPDVPVIEEVIRVALVPVIVRCEATFGESLAARVAVMAGGTERQTTVALGARGHEDDDPRGTVRLTFRTTFRSNRLRFHMEAIYRDRDAAKSGFSGFSISGDVTIGPGPIVVRTKGGAYHNNVWEWQGWR